MGYYTYHNLEIFDNRTNLDNDYIKKLAVEKLKEFNVINYALDEDLYCYGEAKWYDSEEHMRKLSSEIKDVVFWLHGEGEETGDMWDEYYLNGLMQHCHARIEFDPFNESELG